MGGRFPNSSFQIIFGGPREYRRPLQGGGGMQVVTIPFNYEELSPSEQAGIVPICIRSADDEGNPIDWGWFEATARVQDPLRTLARSWLHDVWRVSEITEAAVQSLWRKHGHSLGRSPSRRVYVAARWQAQDKKFETWQSRRGVLLALDDLEQVVRQRVLIDPADYGRVYEDDLYFKELSARLESEGLEHVSQTLKLLRDGCTWDEIGREVGKSPDAARMGFRRWITRLFSALSSNDPAQQI